MESDELRRTGRGRFASESVDPITGITTTQEKTLIGDDVRRSRRVDKFPDGYPRRIIEEDNILGKSYEIQDKQHDLYTSIELSIPLARDDRLRVQLQADDESDISVSFSSSYEKGSLNSFSIGIEHRRAGSDVIDMRMHEKVEHFRSREINENLGQLIDIYKFNGVSTFYSTETGNDINDQRKQALEWTRTTLETSGYADDQIGKLFFVSSMITGELLERVLGSELTETEREEIVLHFTPNVVLSLVAISSYPENATREEHIGALSSAVVMTLANHYERIKNMDNTDTRFTATDSEGIFEVITEDVDEEILMSANLKAGESYVYGEEKYKVINKDGRIILEVASILPSVKTRRIEFQSEVDFEEFEKIVSSDDCKTWEKATGLYGLSYSVDPMN